MALIKNSMWTGHAPREIKVQRLLHAGRAPHGSGSEVPMARVHHAGLSKRGRPKIVIAKFKSFKDKELIVSVLMKPRNS